MKYLSLFVTAGMVLLFSCEKNNNNGATADVQGTWLGQWSTTDSSIYGTFLVPANQDGDRINGEMFIYQGLPSGNGYRPEYSGRIDGDKAKVFMEVSSLDVFGNGDVTDENVVEGEFSVSGYANGSFYGNKYPLLFPEIEVVSTLENSSSWYNYIFLVDDNLWLTNNDADNIEVFNKNGEKISERDDKFISFNPTVSYRDTFRVYSLEYWEDQKISIFNKDGVLLDDFVIDKGRPDGLAYKDGVLYCSYRPQREIFAYNEDGVLVDSTNIDYINFSTFLVYEEGFLVSGSYTPYLFYINKEGELLKTFNVEHDVFSIAYDISGDIYCLAVEFKFGGSTTLYTYRIIKVNLG